MEETENSRRYWIHYEWITEIGPSMGILMHQLVKYNDDRMEVICGRFREVSSSSAKSFGDVWGNLALLVWEQRHTLIDCKLY